MNQTPHADGDCTICGGTGWVDGRMRTGSAHSMRAVPVRAAAQAVTR